jgi:ribonuclease Z
MRPSFLPRLINGPFDDPGLFIRMTHSKRAMLFDLGDLSGLSPGDILKTSHVFITHTHMDHFVGFDRMLRLLLGRERTLYLFGPRGFIDNVAAKLNAYTWNLVHNYAQGLIITAVEIRRDRRITQHFPCVHGFRPSKQETTDSDSPVVWHEPGLQIQAVLLDHKIPSLAFAVQERFHVNILKPRLDALGLRVGPWLNHFKALLFRQADPATEIRAPLKGGLNAHRTFSLGPLADQISRITPGQKVAYVADAVHSKANTSKIISLARGADHLFIEAAFLDAERDIARAKYHLTAHQAGTLARKASVAEMTIFHHSPRYRGQQDQLRQEAQAAFKGVLQPAFRSHCSNEQASP